MSIGFRSSACSNEFSLRNLRIFIACRPSAIAEKEHVKDAMNILNGKSATDQQKIQTMHKDKYGNMVLGGNR